MEPRGRNRWQPLENGPCPKPQQQAKTVAVGCDQLPRAAHGKEGVSGSSPKRALQKLRKGALVSRPTWRFSNSPFVVPKRVCESAKRSGDRLEHLEITPRIHRIGHGRPTADDALVELQ
jgi:hypothetical protein